MDITQLVAASGIDLERTATQLFGQAVEDFVASPLNDALNAAFGADPNAPVNRNDGSWHTTSYAASLVNSSFRPKLKFLFRVEFLFKQTPDVQQFLSAAKIDRNFVFMIKSVDRPKIDFEYEDVNMYNFKTRVLKNIKHRELTMTFMDDVGNNVYEFFRFMMMVHSPITRRSATAGFDIASAYAAYSAGNGMLFTDGIGDSAVGNDFAHRGVIDTDVGGIIQAIKISQMFVDPSATGGLGNAAKEVAFFFINPRVVSFDLDDMNHETNEANLFTMQFDYDFMAMTPMRTLQPLDTSKAMPPWKDAPGDVAPSGTGGASTIGQNDPYTSILAGIAGRAVQKITAETIGREIRKVPGLESVAQTIGGLAQGIAADRVLGIGSAINQSFARPARAVVNDSTVVGGGVEATYITSDGSSSGYEGP
jgi:hypothetical protein